MNIPILNRDFKMPSDGWHQIAARGEYPHASGVMQVLDEAAITAMVNRFADESKSPNFGGLLVDFDHFSYDSQKSSEAAGWITELQNREDGLWGKIRWTSTGKQAVSGGEFRLISPVWLKRDTQPMDGNRIRPMRLDSAGLTNQPNIRGMAPLSNREEPPSTITEQKPTMTKTLLALGLAADATDDAAVSAVTALSNRATTAEAALATATAEAEPLKNRVQTLEAEKLNLEAANKALANEQIEADLNRYGNRFTATARPRWQAALLTNRADTLALLESLPAPTQATTQAAVLNRAEAKTPTPKGFKEAIDEECKNSKCSRGKAMDIVKNREPELHAEWLKNGGGAL